MSIAGFDVKQTPKQNKTNFKNREKPEFLYREKESREKRASKRKERDKKGQES